jgi:hypothetical protein
VGLRKCLLEELQPSSKESNVTEKGFMYDEHLHSSMQKFWDLFSTRIFTQKVTYTRCNNITTTEEPFSELVLKFPQSHHESDQVCTLKELISHHNGPEDIHDYRCNSCDMLTFARQHSIINQYLKVLCIVLGRKKTNDTIIKLAVKYHLLGLQSSQCVQEHQENVGL